MRALPAALFAVAVAAACTSGPPELASEAPTVAAMADELGRDVVEHMARGYRAGRSGEILLAPKPWNVLGQWTGGLRGALDPRTTHATPWAYHQRVPLLLYGPGYIRQGARAERTVDVADVAPTLAEILGMPFRAPAGEVLGEAVVPAARRPGPPRVILVVVYDGGGWNVLDRWPSAWPAQRDLSNRGTVYTNATVGSSPSLTAPVHATIGTGAYPRAHGLVENTARLPSGEISEVYLHEADPELLEGETVADAWDRRHGNRPWVGLVGFESWHLGMMGAGAKARGGDRDVAVLWEREEFRYRTNPEVYRMPGYLPGTDLLQRHLRSLDRLDGVADGRWLGNRLDGDSTFQLPGTPAYVRYIEDTIAEILRREPIGDDELTDLVFVEFKSSDYAGHIWNMASREVREVLAAQDAALERLIGLVEARAGRGRYVVALTADHGQSPIPVTRGGVRIDRFELERDIDDFFGADIVEAVHPSDIYLRMDVLREEGVRVADVARFIGDYRYEDGIPDGTDTDGIPERTLRSRVFAGALPGSYVAALSPGEIEALGPSRYAQGDLTTPPRLGRLLGPRLRR
ncbi:MAG TPA: alkaline phosphatase family protein [Actinomycetota bacterium]|nr:alkaline phosphatase family protein [Actinomycetota bacterium]